MKRPLVSCLTITRDRPELLRRCVEQFFAQTYPEKELIIVVDPRSKWDEWLPEFEIWLGEHPGVSIYIGKSCTVGGLRNETVKQATGKIVATWDDDDYNHPERIARQVIELEKAKADGAKASYLQNAALYMADTKKLSIACFDVFGLAPSMVAWKEHMPPYPELERASDSWVQKLHHHGGGITTAPLEAWLYGRVYHGKNIWEREHFERIFSEYAFRGSWIAGLTVELGLQIPKLFGEDEAPKEVWIHGGARMTISP